MHSFKWGFPDGSVGEESACNAGDPWFLGGKKCWGREKATHSSILAWRTSPWGSKESDRTKQLSFLLLLPWWLSWQRIPSCNAGDPRSIPGLGRSPGEGKKLSTPVFWPVELVHGVTKSQTGLSNFHFWRRKWQPTPVFLPGKSRGWRSLVAYSPWGCKESDRTEWIHFHFFLYSTNIYYTPNMYHAKF